MQLLYSAPAPYVRAHLMPHVTILKIAIFWAEQSSGLMSSNTAKHVKKEQRQVNKNSVNEKGEI